MADPLPFPGRHWFEPGDPPLRVAFVNNMPDAAFDETHTQFAFLLAASNLPVDLACYFIESVSRLRNVAGGELAYRPVNDLYENPPDALIITGTEPRFRCMEDEPYWTDLSRLIGWAVESVPSVLSSCLASHAALQVLDGLRREPLPAKLSGVFVQDVHSDHELAMGLRPGVEFPHSRLNDIPLETVVRHGLRPVVASPETGWTVLTRRTDAGDLVLFQGHPEYSRTTLLREYRRDVRRYFEGVLDRHPDIPAGYLNSSGVALLEAFRRECENGASSPDDFPFDSAVDQIFPDLTDGSITLIQNWLLEAKSRSVGAEMVNAGGAGVA